MKNVSIDLDGNQWVERAVVSSFDAVKQFGGTATLLASMVFGKFDLDANLSGGGGWWKDRGLTDADADPSVRLTDNWLKQMDYRLLPRISVGGTVTWHAPFVEGLSFQLSGGWIRSFKIAHLGGKNREIATIKIAYDY